MNKVIITVIVVVVATPSLDAFRPTKGKIVLSSIALVIGVCAVQYPAIILPCLLKVTVHLPREVLTYM